MDLPADGPGLSSFGQINALVTGDSSRLRGALDLDTLRSILRYPTWGFVVQAICRTRSYQAGLEGGLLLLRHLESDRDQLSKEEFERCWQTLASHHLNMLDKLDRWEEYLETWDNIRSNASMAVTYAKDARESHGGRIDPYVLHEDARTLYVHFLYLGSHRRAVIERKLARKRAGGKLGNLYHAPRSELTDDEIRNRIEWIRHLAFTYG